MADMNRIIRGQIWYWEDPVYGSKNEGYRIEDGECQLRYSRYVLVIQNETTFISSPTILVAPLTSTNGNLFDVPVNLFGDRVSYIRCRSITPVYPRSLTKYIGTISNEIMEKIEENFISLVLKKESSAREIIHQVVPEIHNELDTPEGDGVPEAQQPVKEIQEEPKQDKRNLRALINLTDDEKLVFLSLYETEKGSIDAMLKAYPQLKNEQNVKRYIQKYQKQTGIEITFSDKQDTSEKTAKTSKIWTTEKKNEFINSCTSIGIIETGKSFGLTEQTAKRYYYNWKDKKTS